MTYDGDADRCITVRAMKLVYPWGQMLSIGPGPWLDGSELLALDVCSETSAIHIITIIMIIIIIIIIIIRLTE